MHSAKDVSSFTSFFWLTGCGAKFARYVTGFWLPPVVPAFFLHLSSFPFLRFHNTSIHAPSTTSTQPPFPPEPASSGPRLPVGDAGATTTTATPAATPTATPTATANASFTTPDVSTDARTTSYSISSFL